MCSFPHGCHDQPFCTYHQLQQHSRQKIALAHKMMASSRSSLWYGIDARKEAKPKIQMVSGVQEQLMLSGDRERELQRQLTQAALQAEALLEGSQAAAAAESEELVKGLIQQRDTANEAVVVC